MPAQSQRSGLAAGFICEQRRLGFGQRGDHAHRDDRLDPAEEEQVLERHRRDRDAERVGRVERLAAGGVSEAGLDAELEAGDDGGRDDGDVRGDAGGDDAASRAEGASPATRR